jgi:hypothetical protein
VVTEQDLTEYLDEIRKDVCSICVERPPGGPPCKPLGKDCGIELHLPQLIETIHEVRSSLIEPYLKHNRSQICSNCTFLHSSICPCPMDYLAVPLVQAVEAVDERRQHRAQECRIITSLLGTGRADVDDIVASFAEAEGRWTGCDWPTRFGKTGLDLNGMTAAEARAAAEEAVATEVIEDWNAAASWLKRLEDLAEQAELHAVHAVEAAKVGDWPGAVSHARWARALEFASNRAVWREGRLTWGPFCKVVEEAAGAIATTGCAACGA